jgi:predicted RNase H-like nuclease
VAVLGVDACRGGWAGVVLDDDLSVHGVYAIDIGTLAAHAASAADVAVIAVDMPIGLPDTGQRTADKLARREIGPRWPSVFMTPVRAALLETGYAAATRRSQALAGAGISQQVFALRPRLFEVDEWVRLATEPVIEVHPEVSFATLAGTPLPYAKKRCAGVAQRRQLLAREGIAIPDDLGRLGEHAAVDDVLDAAVAAWSARRYAAGVARSYPDPPEVFSDGHSSAIWA